MKQALLDRNDHELNDRYKVKLGFIHEDEQVDLIFSCLDYYEVKQLFGLFSINYRIVYFNIAEV